MEETREPIWSLQKEKKRKTERTLRQKEAKFWWNQHGSVGWSQVQYHPYTEARKLAFLALTRRSRTCLDRLDQSRLQLCKNRCGGCTSPVQYHYRNVYKAEHTSSGAKTVVISPLVSAQMCYCACEIATPQQTGIWGARVCVASHTGIDLVK